MRVDVFQMCPDLDVVRAGLTVPTQASHGGLCPLPLPGHSYWPLFWGGREMWEALLGAGGDSTPRTGNSRGPGGLGDRRWGGLGGGEGHGENGAGTWRKGCWKLCSLLPPQPWAAKLSAHLQQREKVKPCSAAGACGQAHSSQGQEAILGGLGPEWGSLSKGPVSMQGVFIWGCGQSVGT